MFELDHILSGVLSILLGMVAFLVRQLIIYLKRVSRDLSEMKSTMRLIEVDFKGSHDLLNQKFEFLNSRMNRIENLTINKDENERT